MQFSNISHLKFLFELRFEAFQFNLGYSACQYDKVVHIGDFHQQILLRLFDVEQMIRLAPTKAFDNEERVDTTVPHSRQLPPGGGA